MTWAAHPVTRGTNNSPDSLNLKVTTGLHTQGRSLESLGTANVGMETVLVLNVAESPHRAVPAGHRAAPMVCRGCPAWPLPGREAWPHVSTLALQC